MRFPKAKDQVDRVCIVCGKPFQVEHWRLKWSSCQCCSNKCVGKLPRHPRVFASTEELSRLYTEETLTLEQIAKRYGVTLQAVAYRLKSVGIPRRPYKGTHLRSPEMIAKSNEAKHRGADHHMFHNIPIDQLRIAYEAGATTMILATRYQVCVRTITNKLRIAGASIRCAGFGNRLVCKDGHVAESKWEQLVDDWLTDHSIPHEIHPPLPFATRGRADFLVKGRYIEVWGITRNSKYLARRRQKLALFADHGFILLEVWPKHIQSDDWNALDCLV